MDPDKYFDEASTLVNEEYQKNDCDLRALPPEFAVFHRVEGAQGIIDNGGLVYFFECDWLGCPPYAEFAAAYRAIGCDAAAKCIEDAASSFPFEEPELHWAKRREYIKENYDEEIFGVRGWDDSICGDETVYPALGLFVMKHAETFRLRPPN